MTSPTYPSSSLARSVTDASSQEAKNFQVRPVASLEKGSLFLEIPCGHRLKAAKPSL
jgi:hypothetical protein